MKTHPEPWKTMENQLGTTKNQTGTIKNHEKRPNIYVCWLFSSIKVKSYHKKIFQVMEWCGLTTDVDCGSRPCLDAELWAQPSLFGPKKKTIVGPSTPNKCELWDQPSWQVQIKLSQVCNSSSSHDPNNHWRLWTYRLRLRCCRKWLLSRPVQL